MAVAVLDAAGRPMARKVGSVRNELTGWSGGGPGAGGIDAGKIGRRLRSMPTATQAINSQIRQYGRSIVARSRYLSINNPYAAMAREAYVSSLVGVGITPSPQTADLELRSALKDVWDQWTLVADADGLTDFYGLQTVVAGEMFEGGECFIRIRPRLPDDGFVLPFQLQVLPSEMLPVWKNVDLGNGRRIECGIEFNAIGQRVAYHFHRVHPGTDLAFGVPQWDLVPVSADEVIHLYRPIRAGQIRGIPHTLSAIATLASLDLYDDAELERKRIAALFTAFIKRPAPDEVDPIFGSQTLLNPDFSNVPQSGPVTEAPVMEPGATVELDPGEEVTFSEPADVGQQYEPFQYRNLLRVAAGFGVPYAEMTGDLRQANYGSIRAGLITFRRRITAIQHQILVPQLCRKVWARFLQEAVLAQAVKGLTPAAFLKRQTEFNQVKWQPPAWEWIDPLKDVQAEAIAVQQRFKPRSYTIEEQGFDKEEVDKTISEDQKRLRAGNVPLVQPLPARELTPIPRQGGIVTPDDPHHPIVVAEPDAAPAPAPTPGPPPGQPPHPVAPRPAPSPPPQQVLSAEDVQVVAAVVAEAVLKILEDRRANNAQA